MKKKIISVSLIVALIAITCCFISDRSNKICIKKDTLYKGTKQVADVYYDGEDEEHYKNPDDYLNTVFVNHVSVIGQKKAFDIDGGYCNLLEVQIEPTAAESENWKNKTQTYNAYLIVTKDRNIVIDPEPSNYDDKILEDDSLIKFLKNGDFDI